MEPVTIIIPSNEVELLKIWKVRNPIEVFDLSV